ncbi:unnamed protein product [Chrysoparadoxa australica]
MQSRPHHLARAAGSGNGSRRSSFSPLRSSAAAASSGRRGSSLHDESALMSMGLNGASTSHSLSPRRGRAAGTRAEYSVGGTDGRRGSYSSPPRNARTRRGSVRASPSRGEDGWPEKKTKLTSPTRDGKHSSNSFNYGRGPSHGFKEYQVNIQPT